MIERKVLKKLRNLYSKPDILALIGVRGVGKTTLMRVLFDEEKSERKVFLSFDDVEILRLFEEDIKGFASLYFESYDFIFIDEFQYAREGGKKLKYLYDTFGKKIVISGSSAAELTIQSLSYLVGRVFVEEILPVSFEEFLSFKDKKLVGLIGGVSSSSLPLVRPYFEEYLKFGGYPQVIVEKSEDEKISRLKQIVNTYLLKEIRDILQYKDSILFEKLLSVLALQDGSILNKSKVSSLLGISILKLDELLDVLEKTYVIYRLRPFKDGSVKELIKSPKIYFRDLGFKNYLISEFKEISSRLDKGVLYENFVLNSLLFMGKRVYFYNYKNSSEVDFLFETEGGVVAVEVKSFLPSAKVERGLYSYLAKYSPKKVVVLNESVFGDFELNGYGFSFLHFINIFGLGLEIGD